MGKFEYFSRTFYIKFHSFSRPYGVFKNSPGPGKWILFSRTFKEMLPPCCYHVLAICALTYLVIICAVIHVERFKFTIVYFCLWFLYQFFESWCHMLIQYWYDLSWFCTVFTLFTCMSICLSTFLHFVTLLNKHSINLTLHDIAVLMHAAKTVLLSKLSHLLHFSALNYHWILLSRLNNHAWSLIAEMW